MDKFIKRIQSRLTYSGISATKAECRAVYQQFIPEENWNSPSSEQIALVVRRLGEWDEVTREFDSNPPALAIQEPQTSEDLLEPIPQPEVFEIPVESMPCLQPPDETQPSATPSGSLELTSQSNTNPSGLVIGGQVSDSSAIAAPQVANLVSSLFANQPTEVKDQITEYALQQSFANVRQIQEFLEQLRGMEFNLLSQTLQDHFSRRGSMISQLNNLITNQGKADQQKRDDFFDQFNTRLQQLQEEMELKLANQTL